MTRFCPVCGARNEAAALRCECGWVFTAEVEASQSLVTVRYRRDSRRRAVKKAGIVLGAIAIFLSAAAYMTGFFQPKADADRENRPAPLVAEAPPSANQPVAPIFPQGNVTYKAVRAITGSAIAVADVDGQERRVTLLGIRAPKLDENFGAESKEHLWTLVANKPMSIRLRKFTKEVDAIAEVMIEGSNVGLEQLRSGLAVLAADDVVGLPSAEQQQYLLAAESAKSGKYGLWSGKHPAEIAQLERSAHWGPSEGHVDQTVEAYDPLPAETRRSGPRRQPPGSSFNPQDYDYESTRAAPLVSEPAKQKEQPPPADVAPKETTVPREPAKAVVAPPPAGGRKFIRGPFGGCYYINSNGNKSYVDRSKCE